MIRYGRLKVIANVSNKSQRHAVFGRPSRTPCILANTMTQISPGHKHRVQDHTIGRTFDFALVGSSRLAATSMMAQIAVWDRSSTPCH